MLSISDEESSKMSSPKGDSKQSPEDSTHGDPSIKPNFVYIVSVNYNFESICADSVVHCLRCYYSRFREQILFLPTSGLLL